MEPTKAPSPTVDGVLLEWGAHLYYPRPKRVKPGADANLALHGASPAPQSAAEIRSRIAATVRRAPQAVVKITGGSRGMKYIKAHFRYISKQGKLDITDERGNVTSGKEGLKELAGDWQVGGSFIPDVSGRKEAFHIALSMPRGTDGVALVAAARDFAAAEFGDHKYGWTFHDHQANPHVHLVVRAESRLGKRLNPRKVDLQRWREGFAQALRSRGIDAQATRQATHGAARAADPIWRLKACEKARLKRDRDSGKASPAAVDTMRDALTAWGHVHNALAKSSEQADRDLAREVKEFLKGAPSTRELMVRDAGARGVGERIPDEEAIDRGDRLRGGR